MRRNGEEEVDTVQLKVAGANTRDEVAGGGVEERRMSWGKEWPAGGGPK